MGVDIVVLAEHQLGILSPKEAAQRLATTTCTLQAHASIWGVWSFPSYTDEQLAASQWEAAPDISYGIDVLAVQGPFGVRVDIGTRACLIHPNPRWGAFVSQPLVQTAVTSFCNSVAIAIGAPSLIYLPDSSYGPSRALDLIEPNYSQLQILEYLRRECGPAASDISDIRRELDDDEVRRAFPDWNFHTDVKLLEYDGYFVANVTEQLVQPKSLRQAP